VRVPIVMTTFDRQPAYVHDTLKSLFEMDPTVDKVTLIVSERRAPFLGEWRDDERVDVMCFSPALLEDHATRVAKARTALCSRTAIRSVTGPVILLQDDLDFAERWYERSLEIIESLDDASRSRSLVALYSPYPNHFGPLAAYPKDEFYGAQALFLGDEIRRHFVWALDQAKGTSDDVLMKLALKREPILNAFALNPSLVQHVGKETTVNSGWFHESPTFVKEEPPPPEKPEE
jgi:hypothetical protein